MKILAIIVATGAALLAVADEPVKPPSLQEVYSLIRSNVPGVSDAQLDQAAIQGLLSSLRPPAVLLTNAAPPPEPQSRTLIARQVLLDNAFGYLRVGVIRDGLGQTLDAAVEQLRSSGKLTGLILDLRAAEGTDYAAAVAAADRFLTTERPLLQWGDKTAGATTKDKAIELPMTVLLSGTTTGAAEALAAILQSTKTGLLIGSKSSGTAQIPHDVPLSTGQRLRLPGASVQLVGGAPLAPNGVQPDIFINLSREDEKAFLEDAYRMVSKSGSVSARTGDPGAAGVASTNRPSRRRINEAELVRMQREGIDPDGDLSQSPGEPAPQNKLVTDPVLARAMDFLKGLAIVQGRR